MSSDIKDKPQSFGRFLVHGDAKYRRSHRVGSSRCYLFSNRVVTSETLAKLVGPMIALSPAAADRLYGGKLVGGECGGVSPVPSLPWASSAQTWPCSPFYDCRLRGGGGGIKHLPLGRREASNPVSEMLVNNFSAGIIG